MRRMAAVMRRTQSTVNGTATAAGCDVATVGMEHSDTSSKK